MTGMKNFKKVFLINSFHHLRKWSYHLDGNSILVPEVLPEKVAILQKREKETKPQQLVREVVLDQGNSDNEMTLLEEAES